MRDILFRGKELNTNKWIEGGIVHQTDWYGENVDRYFIIDGTQTQDYNIGYEYEVDPETVGQYTELLDKSGKKIFKGDILKNSKCFGSTSGVVVFNEGGFEIKGLTPYSPETICYGFWQVKSDIEVIGNIHDNPELLKVWQ